MHAPLSTVIFFRHAATCVVRHVDPSEAFRRIANTFSIPLWEPARCAVALELIDSIVSHAMLIEAAYPLTPAAATWLLDVAQQRAR